VNGAFVGVGSNIRPEENILEAVDALHHTPGIRVAGISTFYRTPALPPPGSPIDPEKNDPDYLNGVLEIRTTLGPQALVAVLEGVESALGRVRTGDRYAPRAMDLDLLLFFPPLGTDAARKGGQADASLPHPEVRTRSFVALPLFELAPDLLLPPDGIPLKEVVASFPGPGGKAEESLTKRLRNRFQLG
jgi:2-amino-4-hydroxy-6-hydroxymethyldihydropteridine diphosphokinase